MPMETKLNGYTLKIIPDENPLNPRTDCDHLGIMLCWHRRYSLGDGHPYDTPQDFAESVAAKDMFVCLPVYLLDHSGLYVSVNDFNDSWDSGQLGFIYCTKQDAQKWFNKPDVTEDEIKKELTAEVEEYNDYLNGAWYGFLIEGLDGEVEDSCGGFRYDGSMKKLASEMKSYVSDKYYALFDKLVANNSACM